MGEGGERGRKEKMGKEKREEKLGNMGEGKRRRGA